MITSNSKGQLIALTVEIVDAFNPEKIKKGQKVKFETKRGQTCLLSDLH